MIKRRKAADKLPFEFILDYLYPLEPVIKPMFGCFAYYSGEKIVFIVRKKKDMPEQNGIWVATSREHHESLKAELPSLGNIGILGKDTEWQMRHEDDPAFERYAIRICELVKLGDERVGRIPKKKKSKKRTS